MLPTPITWDWATTMTTTCMIRVMWFGNPIYCVGKKPKALRKVFCYEVYQMWVMMFIMVFDTKCWDHLSTFYFVPKIINHWLHVKMKVKDHLFWPYYLFFHFLFLVFFGWLVCLYIFVSCFRCAWAVLLDFFLFSPLLLMFFCFVFFGGRGGGGR